MLLLTDGDIARFWRKVIKTESCWVWTGSSRPRGYGCLCVGRKNITAHRVSLAISGVEIPEGQDVDHLCRNHGCVNPSHLEIVSHRVNVLRGTSPAARNAVVTHCLRGHEYTAENTLRFDGGRRRCRICTNAKNRLLNRKHQAAMRAKKAEQR